MARKVILNNQEYELIKNYRDAFNEKELIDKFTEYFNDYDYVVGDIAYSKLRLKGFYNPNNKKANKINNYKNIDNYLQKNCAVDCKHFIIRKKDSNEK